VTALLLDVGHTLLHPAVPVEETYVAAAAARGLVREAPRVRAAFHDAFAHARPPDGGLRYTGDGRPFWRRVVARALGTTDPEIFEALFQHYARPEAWVLAEGAVPALDALRSAGVLVALVSDWDIRLRPLLRALGLLDHVDHASISCEVGVEKPDPRLFLDACTALGVPPNQALHLGDDPHRDARGARLAGCTAWTWGVDLQSFTELPDRIAALRTGGGAPAARTL